MVKHGPEAKLPIVKTQKPPPLLLIRVPLLEKTKPTVTKFIFPATVAGSTILAGSKSNVFNFASGMALSDAGGKYG
jgi:hypothetical protein